jgi:hypothetical protein
VAHYVEITVGLDIEKSQYLIEQFPMLACYHYVRPEGRRAV